MSEIVVLCGKPHGCCAKLEKIDDDKYIVYDDFGGKTQLTKDEREMLRVVEL